MTLGIVGNVILNTPWGSGYINNQILTNVLKAVTYIIAVFPALFAFARAEARARDSEIKHQVAETLIDQQVAIDKLRDLLRAAIVKLFEGENLKYIRANISVVTESKLKILCSINMEFSNDYNVEFAYGQGCAGTAWRRGKEAVTWERWLPIVEPKAKLQPKKLKELWHLSDAQIKKTTGVFWIVSTPIFRYYNYETTVLGVLNFDGVEAPLRHPTKIQNETFHKDCADIAEHFGSLLVENNLV